LLTKKSWLVLPPTAAGFVSVAAMRNLVVTSTLMLVSMAGCVLNSDQLGEISQAATVKSYETTSCSTSVVLGLSLQIADEVNCILPGQLVRFEQSATIEFTSAAVLPYLDPAGHAALVAASTGSKIRINSAFRTVAQQYLLRRWKDLGRCGITAAALPARSNHESGRAVDIDNYVALRSKLRANGWIDNVAGDDVHFEHLTSPDIRGADVQAFQRLWNRNHPTELLAEDGDYGAMTAARLAQAPGEGFAIGAMACGQPPSMMPTGSFPNDTPDGEPDDPGTASDGGCRTGGSGRSSWMLMLIVVAAVMRRRR
jgi:MYXO-CTERM domain-containing protein